MTLLIEQNSSQGVGKNYQFLSSCTNPKSKWIKDIHIKPDTLYLMEEKVGKSLEHIGTEGNFMDRTSMAYALSSLIDKWYLMKLKNFYKGNGTVDRTKQQQGVGKNYQSYMS